MDHLRVAGVAAGDRVGSLVFDDRIRAFVPAQRSRGSLQAVRDEDYAIGAFVQSGLKSGGLMHQASTTIS